ncbi:MAG: PaaI family thioesterase [Hyphomicrobiales bacterium]
MDQTSQHPLNPRLWLPDDTPPEGQRAALHRLAAALRRTISALMESNAPEDELNAAAEAAERFAASLEAGPQGRAHWGYAESSISGNPSAFLDNSPVIGLGNPVAPPLKMTVVEGGVEGRVTFGIQYEGPPGHVHGGFVAAAFDDVLGMVQSTTGNPGMTGTLTVRYRRPTPLYREVCFRGRLVRVEGRKIFTEGKLFDGDTLCAEAEAVFISVGRERFEKMAEER